MHILVTNDDGIDSPGLWALAGAMRAAGAQVSVVAPTEEQSAMSMALPPQAQRELRAIIPPAEFDGMLAFAHNGSPVACVTIAMLSGVLPPIDAVVSGINRGLNSGTNVMLSGTVGAAMIGAMWGLPAMAVSLQYRGPEPMPWQTAAYAAQRLFPLLEQIRGQAPLVLNVNVPHVASPAELRGFRQTRLSEFFFGRYLDLELNPPGPTERSQITFHFVRERIPSFAIDTDDGAVLAGYVSVTPLRPMMDGSPVRLELPEL
ncbi:5'/3'-nucleotidase SurE [Chloroflexus sp.]|uniref:5'/3'-nucleotidase SurE n=1 Tax=Chloroflexus sp. TaxID=1904827 RepID=UPI00298EF0BB|nr:5'/3'-nucleotidase SurE [Chloroflexus sp.]MDW8403318.1 5'/3'-nucleotidase SurE [Chloroflexus sp.]